MKKRTVFAFTALAMLLTTQSDTSLARVISFQAVLEDSTGGTQQATVPMIFKIYDSASKSPGEGETLIWTEVHPGVSVSANGMFTVELGAGLPFPDGLFEDEVWLEIVVNGQTISPRTRLASSPYAFVGGRIVGDIITSPGLLQVPGLDSTDWIELTSTGFTFPTQTQCYVVPPCAWNPGNGGSIYTYNVSSSGGSIYAWSTSALAFDLLAETHLPLGATITGMEVFVKDGDVDQDMQFHLVRVSHNVSNAPVTTNLATVTSSGSGGIWQKLTVGLSHNITDLSDGTYIVTVDIPAGTATGATLEWGIVKICYSTNKLVIRP